MEIRERFSEEFVNLLEENNIEMTIDEYDYVEITDYVFLLEDGVFIYVPISSKLDTLEVENKLTKKLMSFNLI
ncbi:MAG: hypothetical protein E6423_02245 [Clostridium sp.]|nr:hypothetical protein [Clostridium sp.]